MKIPLLYARIHTIFFVSFFPILSLPSISLGWFSSCYPDLTHSGLDTTTTTPCLLFFSFLLRWPMVIEPSLHALTFSACRSASQVNSPLTIFCSFSPSPGLPHHTSYISLLLSFLPRIATKKMSEIKKIKLLFSVSQSSLELLFSELDFESFLRDTFFFFLCLWSGTLFFPWTTSCLLHHWWHPFFKHLSSFAYPRHHCHSHSSTTHNPCHSLQLYLGISKEEEDVYMWISTSGQRTDKDWMRASRLSLLLCSTPYPQGNKNSSPGKESN